MGAFPASRRTVSERLTEMVGYRAGLAVSEPDILRSLKRRGCQHLYPPPEGSVRMRSETFDIMSRCVTDSFILPGSMRAMRPLAMAVGERVGSEELAMRALSFIDAVLSNGAPPQTDAPHIFQNLPFRLYYSMPCPSPEAKEGLRETVRRTRGKTMVDAVDAAVEELEFRDFVNPWKQWTRTVEWDNVLELSDLFVSDSVTASYGQFFDQRHINYLVSNCEDLAFIHWRKFEALAAEHFHRAGFDVEIGPGRNDNGVDIRVWETTRSGLPRGQTPPVMIVQCKREKRKISKVVVKALAADVAWEKAEKGLVVATVDWSPGAREVVRTRSYPVEEVNAGAVRDWLTAMQSCHTGLWLPE